MRQLYIKRKEAGICTKCGKQPSLPERITCDGCSKRESIQSHKRYKEKQWYNKRKLLGLCTKCGKEPIQPECVCCINCLEKFRQITNKRYQKNKFNNLCGCGNKPLPNKKSCERCCKLSKKAKDKLKANNRCEVCGKLNASELVTCDNCRIKKSEKNKERYCYRKESELCIMCGKQPPVFKRSRCVDCTIKRLTQRLFGSAEKWEDLYNLLLKQNYLCPYSGELLQIGVNASLDHKIPKALGGTNNLSNLQWVHQVVNSMKWQLIESDFFEWINRIQNYSGNVTK